MAAIKKKNWNNNSPVIKDRNDFFPFECLDAQEKKELGPDF